MDEDIAELAPTPSRPRRTRVAVAAALAVVAVVAGTALFAALDTTPGRAAETPGAAIPAGTRLVGVGHAAVAVPRDWATNALRCGRASRPTVVVDLTVIPACAWLAPRVFDSISVDRGVNRNMFRPVEQVEIDGVAAQRNRMTCAGRGDHDLDCSGTVFVPSEQASFLAEGPTRQRVEEMLSWIHIVRGRVAVPGFGTADVNQGPDAGERYRAELRAAGLRVRVVTERQRGPEPGYVLGVSPAPGTMLEPGQVVTVTLNR